MAGVRGEDVEETALIERRRGLGGSGDVFALGWSAVVHGFRMYIRGLPCS